MHAVEHYSNAKIRFQSFFMLMIVQACFSAMSYISWLTQCR